MDQVAVFVDAGYLFAQGSVAVSGHKQPRTNLILDAEAAVAAFKALAAQQAAHARLLRIYWYDGAIGGARPTTDQAVLAHFDDVKVRLGFLNSAGQQKGVDSLIVTDMIELARLKSISDAVLMSGDEDVRIGVQIAQSYGVRVHLVGIAPSRASQSSQLMQEADTTFEWGKEAVDRMISLRPLTQNTLSVAAVSSVADAAVKGNLIGAPGALEGAVESFVAAIEATEIDAIAVYWQTDRGVPTELDRRLLPACRAVLGRDLDQAEKKQVRAHFQQLVKARL
jgi:uncharacterized LabA/DUF88 family protein